MKRHLYVITGSSRGLGHALAQQLLAPQNLVLGIARQACQALQEEAQTKGTELLQWRLDLSQPVAAAQALQQWLTAQNADDWLSASLINNAALLTPPGPMESVPLESLSSAMRVGLEAPALLSAAFLQATQSWAAPRKVLNISSGLGRYAMAGSAPYCAVKAGLDNLSRAMALDEAHKLTQGRSSAGVVSLAPGIIDTDMQQQLRGGNPQHFPDQARFAEFKQQGQLASAEQTASRVLAFLARKDFGQQVLADVREA
ncbi:SDR family NAD(P)-dependent oxidoreductase [Roseateles sp. BYS180W]|uniref:SDR family NAD(P)-dependent oxidoreductase n=1 Tax=Roseateles rivi TaxID=3299028 RepID=A0ABW7FZK3_9BURK